MNVKQIIFIKSVSLKIIVFLNCKTILVIQINKNRCIRNKIMFWLKHFEIYYSINLLHNI